MIEEVRIGDVVDYGLFSNVKVVAADTENVTMEDKSGNTKTVYKKLYLKYARLVNGQ